MPERRTPLYDIHVRLGAQMVKGGGDFLYPLSYTSPVEEHVNTRTHVGMQDLSTMGEVDVKGPGTERLLNTLLVNEIRDMHPGQVRYSTLCNENGGIVDDVTVYKFHDEHFMVVTSSGPRKKTARWIADHAVGNSAYVSDVTAAIGLPVVQGPRARDFLKSVVREADPSGRAVRLSAHDEASGQSLDALRFFWFTPARIGETELLISRSGYTGELGYELYTPAEEVGALWETLLAAGRQFGLKPYGVLAMHSLRLEKGFPLYGADINEDVTPFHAGLERFIRFDKRDFVGREALLRVRESGLDERWVGLALESELPANAQDAVFSIGEVKTRKQKKVSGAAAGETQESELPGEQIGRITISARGHTVGKTLAMAYVRTTHAWPGNRLVVRSGERFIPATVTPTPFFDPQGARMRAKG